MAVVMISMLNLTKLHYTATSLTCAGGVHLPCPRFPPTLPHPFHVTLHILPQSKDRGACASKAVAAVLALACMHLLSFLLVACML